MTKELTDFFKIISEGKKKSVKEQNENESLLSNEKVSVTVKATELKDFFSAINEEKKKLKEQNTRYFSKAQIVLNQATTVIEEPSTRAKTFRSTTGTSGGGSVSTTNITQTSDDGDWLILDTEVRSTRDVKIVHKFAIDHDEASGVTARINRQSNTNADDIFLVTKNATPLVTVNKEGVFSLHKEFTGFPTTVEGGIIYLNNNFYLGL